MEKMKKGISALLAFVMLVSVMLCNMVVSVSAAETTLISKGKALNYTFNPNVNEGYNSEVTLPNQDANDVLSEYNSSDGYVSMTGDMTCRYTTSEPTNAHGLYFRGNSKISFYVEGDATISLGLCAYNTTREGIISVTATPGKITPSECNNSGAADGIAQIFEYTGEQSDITINIPAGTYIHSLGITVKTDPVDPTPTVAGQTYTLNFANNSDYTGFTLNAGQETLIGGSDEVKIDTSGTVSYNGDHGLNIYGKTNFSFVVPGDSTITLGRCQFPATATQITASVEGDGTIYPASCDNRVNTETAPEAAAEFEYEGGEATITFTFPASQSYLHSLTIANAAEAGTGTSFTYWFDDHATDNTVAEFSEDFGGGTLSIPSNFTVYTNAGTMTDGGGTVRNFYRTEEPIDDNGSPDYKGNGSTTALPTEGTALIFTPTNNGEVTLYYYMPTTTGNRSLQLFSGNGSSFTSTSESFPVVEGDTIREYSFNVSNGTTYFIQTTSTGNFAIAGMEFSADEVVTLSVTKNIAENANQYVTGNEEISFTDTASGEVYDVLRSKGSSVELLKGHTYEISVNNAALTASFADGSKTVTVGDDTSALEININAAAAATLTGSITFDDETDVSAISGITSITFENQTIPGLTYTAAIDTANSTYTVSGIMPGEYNTVATTSNGYKTADHVSITSAGESVNEVYFYQDRAVVPETRTSITVGAGEGADYSTLTEAIEAIKANTGRTEQVTISLNSDLEEQVNLDISNVKILGNGHELTWYYALGAQYYSVDSNGYYSEVLYRDAYSRNPVATSFWGGVLIVRGDNVVVEDLTIKNTFNYYVSDKEAKEGIIPDVANQEGSWTEVVADSDVTNIIYKERANAVAPFGDKIEFYNCKILSSQDGLGINGDNEGCSVYYRDCVIGGNIDYICGGGTMLFDNCELEWYIMPGNTNGYGYITAPRKSPYIFRNCTITKSTDDYTTDNPTVRANSGYFGRCWGGADAKAYFINTETNGTINVNGWNEMSSTDPKLADFIEYCNTDNGSPATVTNNGNYASDGATKLTDAEVAERMETYLNDEGIIAALNGWTPSHYVSSIVKDDSVNTVLDNNGNLIVYGFIDSNDIGKASNIGFMLSTLNSFIGKEQQIDDTVYEKVEYTDADGVSQTIADENGGYVFAYVVEGANTYDGTLNIRAIQISNDDTIYGPTATAELTNTSGTGAEEGGTETGTEVTEGTETEQPGTEGTGTDETVTDAGETVTNDADTGDSVTEGE